jgi:undecaprenyl phosphate N,N'-diacetylbacillosamine 1-phosphate transferase
MKSFYNNCIKRLLDFTFSLIVIVVFCWLLLILWVLVTVKLGRPAIFRQERPGKDGGIFTLYKFRTMTDAKDADGHLLPDEDRLTVFGRKLRSTSLDELPELFNILKGDMSLVGPRPLAVIYLPFYTEKEMHRHDVRPGLTGLAQVNGRNALSWEDKFVYDVLYASKVRFITDLKILLKTVIMVLKRDGIGQGAEAPESLHILRGYEGSKE